MSRLAAIARDALPEHQRLFFDAVKAIRRRPVSGPFIVLMNASPDLAARYAHLGHYFHSRGQADESIVALRLRGYLSLLGSRALDAPYEWGAWVNWALEAGVTQAAVDAIREGRPAPHPTAEEQLVTDFFTQMVSGNCRLNETTYAALLKHFGPQGLVELVVTLGYFAMIALPLNAFEIGMSDEQMTLRKPFAPLAVNGVPWRDSNAGAPAMPRPSAAPPASPRLPPLVTHDDVAPQHQHFLDRVVRSRGWVSPVYQALLHSPDIAERIAHIGTFFLYESALPPALNAAITRLAANEFNCPYVWHAAAGHAEKHDTAMHFCRQLLRGNHHADDRVYDAAVAQYGKTATIQIAAALGYQVMMCMIANAFELAPLPDRDRAAL